jgi:hypothetical protein
VEIKPRNGQTAGQTACLQPDINLNEQYMDTTPPPITPLPPATPPAFSARGNDKIWSMFCHLSVFLGIGILLVPLVIYLAMKDESEYVAGNAREALNFHISLLIYGLCCIPLCLIFIGYPLVAILVLSMYILSIVATIKASDGGCYRYPLTLHLIE